MEKLIFERSTPVQGEAVNIYVHGRKGKAGQLVLAYEEWLHFNKLIKEGQDSLKRKNEQRIEIVIQGLQEGVIPVKISLEVEPKTRITRLIVPDSEVEDILGPAMVPLDKEDEKAVEKAEGEQKLVRSLLEEKKDGSN